MTHSRRLIGVVLLSLTALSCASGVGVTQLKPAPAKASTCVLDVYTAESEIKRPFEVVCLLDSQKAGTFVWDKPTVADAIEKAKPAACKCGADALLFLGGDTEGVHQGFFSSSAARGRAMLKGIRYTSVQ